jgi:hypothetical protein
VGKARRVRFRSHGRGIDSVEGKRNDVGLRFVLDPNAGDGGFLIWNELVIPAMIDWRDPVVQHGLRHPIKYVRLVRRRASSPRAQGADHDGNRYSVQLIVEGHAAVSPKHEAGRTDTIGLDIGPSTLAIVPRDGDANLVAFCEELVPEARKKRRVQRKMERQRRANHPENYDERGRVKKGPLTWKHSRRYQVTSRQQAAMERRLAAHRKSLHGNLAHTIAQAGNTIIIEKTSFKGWQKQYGRSIGFRAPGLFVAHLSRIVAKTGGTLGAHLDLQDQTESVLPSVPALCQETPVATLAPVLLRMWAGAARSVLGLPGFPTWNRNRPFPLSPSRSGKVRSRACEP